MMEPMEDDGGWPAPTKGDKGNKEGKKEGNNINDININGNFYGKFINDVRH